MTRTTIIIVTVLGVIAVAICLWRIKSKQLPKKYKDYKYIWDILQTEKYVIVPFDISNSCDSPIFDSDNNIIISTRGDTKKYCEIRYKLDRYGNIKDSLSLYKYYINVFNYYVGENNYISWSIDGDKSEKAYKSINEEPWFNKDSIKDIFPELYNKSAAVIFRANHERNDSIAQANKLDRVYFFDNNQWFTLDGCNLIDYEKYPTKGYRNGFKFMKSHKIPSFFKENDYSGLKTEQFCLEYFHREHYSRRKSVSFMPTGGSGSPNRWSGMGFFNIMLNDDTLRIKMDMAELSANNSSYTYSHSSPYFFYYAENCDFFILKRNELKLYLIKPKEHIK